MDAPGTPPPEETGGGALHALKMLQEAFGESHVSGTACSSSGKPALVPDSLVPVASSSVVASPAHASTSAAHAPDLPLKVPGLTYFGIPAHLECTIVGMSLCSNCS